MDKAPDRESLGLGKACLFYKPLLQIKHHCDNWVILTSKVDI